MVRAAVRAPTMHWLLLFGPALAAALAVKEPTASATPKRRVAAAVGPCFVNGQPSVSLYWEPNCTVGMKGCSADGVHVECRWCGVHPYESIVCPVQATDIPVAAGPTNIQPYADNTWSWVIVGGGASGCAAAAALADAGEDVLLLERGSSDLDVPATQQASTWPYVINTEAGQAIRWTEGVWGVAARVLGGGTSINGGYMFEEQPEWLQSAFSTEIDLDKFYNSSKAIADFMSSPVQPNPYGLAWAAALEEAGQGKADLGQPQLRMKEGAWVPLDSINTSKAGWPRKGAAALVHVRAHLPNLRVITKATVHRILFDGNRASGVRVSIDNLPLGWSRAPFTIQATKGVIVAAGALLTPQLLQVSGVGRKADLEPLGVFQVKELPVGQNFIDRLVLSLGVRAAAKRVPLSMGYVIALNLTANLTFETESGGQLATEFAIASLALDVPSARVESYRGTLKSLFRSPDGVSPTPLAQDINQMMQILALQHHAHSRGSVIAVSQDIYTPPAVTANYYSDSRDVDNQVRAAHDLLRLASTQALSTFFKHKLESSLPDQALTPGLKCVLLGDSWIGRGAPDTRLQIIPCLPLLPASLQDWKSWLNQHIVSSYHYFGTAAFGTVVEGPNFNVKGIDGIHVIDASVIPFPPRVNPQHTIMTVGHYAGTNLAASGRAPIISPISVWGEAPRDPHTPIVPSLRQCSWKRGVPVMPFFWDFSCRKSGGLGCRADGLNPECRFCGTGVYAKVPCPTGRTLSSVAQEEAAASFPSQLGRRDQMAPGPDADGTIELPSDVSDGL